ncbi:MAG TPA: hypothetical protein VF175_19095 [Lacipirellula sp.]
MGHLLRLVALIAAGSVLGAMSGAVLFGASPDNDRFIAAGQLAAIVLGAYLGIAVEMAIRLMIRRKWKFSLAEALVAMTMLAILLLMYQVLSTAYRAN